MVVEYMLCGNRGLQLVGACEVEKAYACSYLCFAYVTYDTCQRPKICVNLYMQVYVDVYVTCHKCMSTFI